MHEESGWTARMKTLLWIVFCAACLYGVLFVTESTPLPNSFMLQKVEDYRVADLEGLAHMAAVLHDVDPVIFKAQIRQESRFNQHAKSPAGAVGVAQIMPETAKGWKVDPKDPLQALDAAARNMGRYMRTYKAQGHDERTSYKMALAAYNAGPGAVAKYKGIPPYPETKNYVSIILPEK